MTTNIKLEMKDYSMILIEKLWKYQPYQQEKLISMNILQIKNNYLLKKKQIRGQVKFIYYPLGKAFEKQTKTIEDQGEKQIDVLKNLSPNTQV